MKHTLLDPLLKKNGFKDCPVPLANPSNTTWYTKDPFAIGVCRDKPSIERDNHYRVYIYFVYGNLLYSHDNLTVMSLKRITDFTFMWEVVNKSDEVYVPEDIVRFIEYMPEKAPLCIDIPWAKGLLDAFFKGLLKEQKTKRSVHA
jgi:hypothetical protein